MGTVIATETLVPSCDCERALANLVRAHPDFTTLGNVKKKHQKIWGFKVGLLMAKSCMLSFFFAKEFYGIKVPTKL